MFSYARHLDRIPLETANAQTCSLFDACVRARSRAARSARKRDVLNLKRIGAITTCASCKSVQQRYVGEADRSVAHAIPRKPKNARRTVRRCVHACSRLQSGRFFFSIRVVPTTRDDLQARSNRPVQHTAPSSVR